MRNFGYKKTKTGFSYYGDLQQCILSAKENIKRLEKETPYIMRRYEEEKKRKDRHLNAISNANRFIALAENELIKQQNEQSDEKEI